MSLFNFARKNTPDGSVLHEEYSPCSLPGFGALQNFITSGYQLLDRNHREEIQDRILSLLEPLTDTTDEYSDPSVGGAFIEGYLNLERREYEQEVAMHEYQCSKLQAVNEVRLNEIGRRLEECDQIRGDLKEQIEPLKGAHPRFDFSIAGHRLPIGALVTVLAMVVDSMLNYGFLQNILLQNRYVLWVTVICLAVLSDGSMFVIGDLLSKKRQRFDDNILYRVIMVGMLGAFVVSIVTGVMLRVGGMAASYGVIDLNGEFVAKGSYNLAEWGATLAQSFLTSVTGLISLYFSVDPGAYLAGRRSKLQKELDSIDRERSALLNEQLVMQRIPDPQVKDEAERAAAAKSLDDLSVELKLRLLQKQVEKIHDPDHTDMVGQVAKELIPASSEDGTKMSNEHYSEEVKEVA